MFLTRLSEVDDVLCCWIFKRPAYAAVDFAGDDAMQTGYAEVDYTDERFGYAS